MSNHCYISETYVILYINYILVNKKKATHWNNHNTIVETINKEKCLKESAERRHKTYMEQKITVNSCKKQCKPKDKGMSSLKYWKDADCYI